MKKLFTLLTTACIATSALAQVFDFSTNITYNSNIPDNNPSGFASSFLVGGLSGTITNVTVNLNISGGYNGDLFAYLAGPGGYVVLLNRVGLSSSNANGYAETGFNVTFQSGAPDIHWYQTGSYTTNGFGQLTGTWGVDGVTNSPLSAGSVFDSAGQTALLDSFLGTVPNGTWGLFVGDYAPGDISTLVSVGLTIDTAAPEPGTVALIAVGGTALLVMLGRRKSMVKLK